MATSLQKRMRCIPPLETVSYFSDSSPESDDRRFISVVEGEVGVRHHHLRFEDYDALADPDWITPVSTTGIAIAELRAACETGVRVILSGRLGDAVMANFVDASTDLAAPLLDGSIMSFLRLTHDWSVTSHRPMIHVLWNVALAFVPPSLFARHAYTSALMRSFGSQDPRRADLVDACSISPDLADAVKSDYESYPKAATMFGNRAKRRTLTALYSYSLRRSLCSPTGHHPIVCSYPYSHRPLVQFVLAVPSHVLFEPGRSRALMRRAFEGFVPRRIMNRRGKGYAAPMVARAFQPIASDLLRHVDHLKIVESGYVDRDRIRSRLTECVNGHAHLGNLPACGALERWLQVRERSASLASCPIPL
jgi:asparagine synthase (glutamine-hydrolysing)